MALSGMMTRGIIASLNTYSSGLEQRPAKSQPVSLNTKPWRQWQHSTGMINMIMLLSQCVTLLYSYMILYSVYRVTFYLQYCIVLHHVVAPCMLFTICVVMISFPPYMVCFSQPLRSTYEIVPWLPLCVSNLFRAHYLHGRVRLIRHQPKSPCARMTLSETNPCRCLPH